MKLNNIELSFDSFATEMAKLKNEKHFDYLVTIIGEDFGEEGLGCIYILENTQNNERCSVKTIAKKVDGSDAHGNQPVARGRPAGTRGVRLRGH